MIKVISELSSLDNFSAWSGGREAIEEFCEKGVLDEVSELVADLKPEGWNETDLNDFIWFERPYIYRCLGLIDEGDC